MVMNISLRAYILACSVCVASNAMGQVVIPYDSSSLTPGIGYDTLTGKVRGQCIDLDPKAPLAVAGEDVRFSLQSVESEYQLDSYLRVSASAKYGGFISGSASVTQESKINRFSSYFLISITVVTRSESVLSQKLKVPKINATSTALLKKSVGKFRDKCGDQFIVGRDVGGEYTALVEVKTSSSEDKSTLDAQISGSSGIFSGTIEGNKRLSEITNNRSVQVTVLRGGGSGDVVVKPDALIDAVTKFPTQIRDQSSAKLKPYRVVLQDYGSLDLPDGISAVTLNDDDRRDFVEDGITYIEGERSALADAKYALKYPEEFSQIDASARTALNLSIKSRERQLVVALRLIRDCVKRGKCGTFTMNNVESLAVPSRLAGITREELVSQLESANKSLNDLKAIANNTFSNNSISYACRNAGMTDPSGVVMCASGANTLKDLYYNKGGNP